MQSAPSGNASDDAEDEDVGFAEINITPLTDVFLVLLIILMVVSTSMIEQEKEQAYQEGQLAERALQIMTPQGSGQEPIVPEDVVLSVLPSGAVLIGEAEIPLDQLDARLKAIKLEKPNVRIVLRGDRTASYDVIMAVISRCNQSGLNNIALASQEPSAGP